MSEYKEVGQKMLKNTNKSCLGGGHFSHFRSPSSFAVDGQSAQEEGSQSAIWEAGRTVVGYERWCCADGTFMTSCVIGA